MLDQTQKKHRTDKTSLSSFLNFNLFLYVIWICLNLTKRPLSKAENLLVLPKGSTKTKTGIFIVLKLLSKSKQKSCEITTDSSKAAAIKASLEFQQKAKLEKFNFSKSKPFHFYINFFIGERSANGKATLKVSLEFQPIAQPEKLYSLLNLLNRNEIMYDRIKIIKYQDLIFENHFMTPFEETDCLDFQPENSLFLIKSHQNTLFKQKVSLETFIYGILGNHDDQGKVCLDFQLTACRDRLILHRNLGENVDTINFDSSNFKLLIEVENFFSFRI